MILYKVATILLLGVVLAQFEGNDRTAIVIGLLILVLFLRSLNFLSDMF